MKKSSILPEGQGRRELEKMHQHFKEISATSRVLAILLTDYKVNDTGFEEVHNQGVCFKRIMLVEIMLPFPYRDLVLVFLRHSAKKVTRIKSRGRPEDAKFRGGMRLGHATVNPIGSAHGVMTHKENIAFRFP
jgi:hypothetical protein